jgi:hypothetical protein
VGLERGPHSLVSTIEELLGRKRNGSGLEIREYGLRDPSRWPRGILYPHKLALTSPTSGGLSVGIVRSWLRPRRCFRGVEARNPSQREMVPHEHGWNLRKVQKWRHLWRVISWPHTLSLFS